MTPLARPSQVFGIVTVRTIGGGDVCQISDIGTRRRRDGHSLNTRRFSRFARCHRVPQCVALGDISVAVHSSGTTTHQRGISEPNEKASDVFMVRERVQFRYVREFQYRARRDVP